MSNTKSNNSYEGVVKPYSGNGRKLGYPTANIEIDPHAEEGIFAGLTMLKGVSYPSVIFIGKPVTVGDTVKRAESHIFDFEDHDLYGEYVEIKTLHKLRDNQLFDSVSQLVTQMKVDETDARHYLKDWAE